MSGARKVLLTVVPSTTWNLHRNKPELCPNRNREVVNLSGLAEQRVKSNVWKTAGIIASKLLDMATSKNKNKVKRLKLRDSPFQ